MEIYTKNHEYHCVIDLTLTILNVQIHAGE